MNSRIRLLITAAFFCHLLVTPTLVTSQLLSPAPDQNAASYAQAGEDVTIRATERQEKDGPVYKLRGHAEIHYRTYVLYADTVDYNSDTGNVIADGHVVLDGGFNDEYVEASHATYNINSEIGRFENVRGTVGLRVRRKRTLLTTSHPFAFTGKVVQKTGPDHYLVFDGTITTCELPHPKWEFNARKTSVEAGGKATIYRSTFRLWSVPILYLPFATHPVEREPRASGFLIPNFGRSSTKGTIVGESVYWAINPSMDATIGTEYFSMRGWAPRGEFRARPSEGSYLDVTYFGVLDRGFGRSGTDQGGHEIHLNGDANFKRLRAVANIDYLSSFVFRLAFNDVFSQAVNSEVKSQAFLSGSRNGYFFDGDVQRYQNFESTTSGDVITILHTPGVESSGTDHAIGHSPFLWSYDAAFEGVSRSEPLFRTAALVGRLDLNPDFSLPLLWRGWSIRPELSLRDTLYTQRLVAPNGGIGFASSDLVNRKVLGTSLEVEPPPLQRIFDREFLGRKWKHVIEPRVTYRYVTGIHDFAEVLRFDERDILSNTSEIEYRLINRLYAKRTSAEEKPCSGSTMTGLVVGRPQAQKRIPWERDDESQLTCPTEPSVREVITWELAQKYYFDPTFGGALVPGQRNVFTTSADFTGIAFLTDSRRFSPIISRLKFQPTSRSEAEWNLDYDFKKGRINSSTAFLNYRFGLFTVGGGDAYLQAPSEALNPAPSNSAQAFNQFRVLFGYGQLNKRGFSGATNLGFDANLSFLQYSAVQLAYNWDCCGLSLEYRRFALGSVRNENQFRFNFALANLGAFGNLRRQEKLF
jgi:LPS-assembly protein